MKGGGVVTGKSHLLAGGCICAQTLCILDYGIQSDIVFEFTRPDWFYTMHIDKIIPEIPVLRLSAICRPIWDFLFYLDYLGYLGDVHGIMWFLFYAVIGSILYMFGTLLPDIDSRKSILGRFMYIPVKHHKITHTLWVVSMLFLMSLIIRPIAWISFGYLVHLWLDSYSRCGVCYFYPISKYIEYPNGAMVKRNHKIKLYRTGASSEGIVTGIIVLITVFLFYFRFHVSSFIT